MSQSFTRSRRPSPGCERKDKFPWVEGPIMVADFSKSKSRKYIDHIEFLTSLASSGGRLWHIYLSGEVRKLPAPSTCDPPGHPCHSIPNTPSSFSNAANLSCPSLPIWGARPDQRLSTNSSRTFLSVTKSLPPARTSSSTCKPISTLSTIPRGGKQLCRTCQGLPATCESIPASPFQRVSAPRPALCCPS